MKISEGLYTKPIIIWLVSGLIMLIIQVVLGGITRLTGSGLSITEWKPLIGAVPPLTENAWQHSFNQYKQIAQFKHLNSHFTLNDYKGIFFWEWFHREWARLIGLVFFIPFVVFVIKKQITKSMIWPMVILFLLGALQGLIGWIMVKSGLNDTSLVVNHIKLAIHFIAALILLLYVLWFILKLAFPKTSTADLKGIKILNRILLLLVCLQMFYGALMAGSHAALYAVTFPDINGVFLPKGAEFDFVGIFNNTLSIQFLHRILAYGIAFTTLIWFIQVAEINKNEKIYQYRFVPLVLVALQILLGIISLFKSTQSSLIYFAVSHQFVGILLTLVVFAANYFSNYRSNSNQ